MATELVKVDFHGDTLDAILDHGVVWVSVRRCCENLGVAIEPQLRKLRAKGWSCMTEMVTQLPGDTQSRTVTMIDLDTLPGWLFSIDARKVKPHIREKLVRYQKEAAKVLADHFFKRGSPPEPSHYLEAVLARIALIEGRMAALVAHGLNTPATPRTSVKERLRFKGWFGTSARQRNQVRRLANSLLDLRHGETPDVSGGPEGGGPCTYYGHQIACLDEAIDRVRAEYQQRDTLRGPGLFGSAAA